MLDSLKVVGLCQSALRLPLDPGAASNLGRLAQALDADPAMVDVRWRAYCLATVLRECGHGFEPICERGQDGYFAKYDAPGSLARQLGNTEPGDGERFKGRGYVQLTGRTHYAQFGQRLGLDLLCNPDLALDPAVAYRIMSDGMVHGRFTGVALGRYIYADWCDYVNARKVINGLDHAEEIAAHAQTFEQALKEAA